MTEIYLIRHGEAEGNIFRRLHGQYDSLLTPRGCAQAECLKERFANIQIDACFSSDLTRACMTARSVFAPKGLRLQRDKRFREVNVGVWEDVPIGYLENFDEQRMRAFDCDPPAWHVDGSERYDTYTSRFLEALEEAARRYDGGTIAIFSHGAVMRGTFARLFFADDVRKLGYSENTGVNRLYYDGGKYTYDYLNDASHLPPELSGGAIKWQGGSGKKEKNLYFVPASSVSLPEEIALRQPEGGLVLAAMLNGKPVGSVALGRAKGRTGVICAMRLLDAMRGRFYGDQMLGCAFSHFREAGCTDLLALPGKYPDDILSRYAFDPTTLRRSIDTRVFDWDSVCQPLG